MNLVSAIALPNQANHCSISCVVLHLGYLRSDGAPDDDRGSIVATAFWMYYPVERSFDIPEDA